LLNRIADASGPAPTVKEVLTDAVNLVYHATLMTPAGDGAVSELRRLYDSGNYILVLEGGVPTAFGGAPCMVYSLHGQATTYQRAVQEMAGRAIAIVCVGTCASFGGIPASGSNPTGVTGVHQLTGRPTVNISGCPANPDWVVWALVQLLTATPMDLDEDSRPKALYTETIQAASKEYVHDKCPRNVYVNASAPSAAADFSDCNGRCLIELGCRGPHTRARCDGCWNIQAGTSNPAPTDRWQNNWCIGVNAPCHGCVERTYPGTESFYERYAPA
jgi:hydrogenase small subunit